jgi:hypothetical protein
MTEFGRMIYTQNVVLRGVLSEKQWREFLVFAVKSLGMTPAGAPAVWQYPTADGKGGNGMTACQPLTDSFMVLDTWSDHSGAYLHISSCKRFDVAALVGPAREFSLAVDFMGRAETLRLDPVPAVNHLDDYPEVPMHSGAPSDPRFDRVEG